jgi:hypothetical protein
MIMPGYPLNFSACAHLMTTEIKYPLDHSLNTNSVGLTMMQHHALNPKPNSVITHVPNMYQRMYPIMPNPQVPIPAYTAIIPWSDMLYWTARGG